MTSSWYNKCGLLTNMLCTNARVAAIQSNSPPTHPPPSPSYPVTHCMTLVGVGRNRCVCRFQTGTRMIHGTDIRMHSTEILKRNYAVCLDFPSLPLSLSSSLSLPVISHTALKTVVSECLCVCVTTVLSISDGLDHKGYDLV